MYGFHFIFHIIILLNITGLFLFNVYAALLDTTVNDYET